MRKNFLMQLEAVWNFSCYQLMRFFWGWMLYTIAQFMFFVGGVVLIALGTLSLVGLDSVAVCYQLIDGIEQGSMGVVSCKPIVAFLEGFSWGPLGILALIIGVVSIAYSNWLNFGVSRIAYRLTQVNEPGAGLFTSVLSIEFARLVRVFGAAVLLALVVVPAFFLFIIPGVFLTIRLIAVFPIMATDASCTVWQAFVQSWKLTATSWRSALWFLVGYAVLYLFVASYLQPFFWLTVFPLARFALFDHISSKTNKDLGVAVEMQA